MNNQHLLYFNNIVLIKLHTVNCKFSRASNFDEFYELEKFVTTSESFLPS